MRKLLTNRKAVSSMIGGIIILTLFLSALSMMVFISQQYDTYQSTVETMNHNDIEAFSENLVPAYPGLYFNSSQTQTGGTCSQGYPYCYQYILYVSNEAAIGTQIARIYINSTDSRPYVPGTQGQSIGCGNLCIFDPSSTPKPCSTTSNECYFLASSAFVNPSEYAHQVILYTNSTYTLPCSQSCGVYGVNSIVVVTTRGRTFSFQWPIPLNPSLTVSSLTTGVMQIAYQKTGSNGYASSNEPGAVKEQSGGTIVTGTYCHSENATEVPTGSTYGTLWFVNPWVTWQIFNNAFPASTTGTNNTAFYVAVQVTNNQQVPITITRGDIWLELTVASGNAGTSKGFPAVLVMGGPMIGTYYNGQFNSAVAQTTTVDATFSVILIYRIYYWNWAGGNNPPNGNIAGVTFSGIATITNDQEGGGGSGTQGYFAGSTIVDGLYVKTSC